MPHHDIIRERPFSQEIDARPRSVPAAIMRMEGRTGGAVHGRASRCSRHAPAPRGTTGTPVRALRNRIAA